VLLSVSDPVEDDMKYGFAWLVGIPLPLIALWFFANQAGCGN
jgi:hypothetical protein